MDVAALTANIVWETDVEFVAADFTAVTVEFVAADFTAVTVEFVAADFTAVTTEFVAADLTAVKVVAFTFGDATDAATVTPRFTFVVADVDQSAMLVVSLSKPRTTEFGSFFGAVFVAGALMDPSAFVGFCRTDLLSLGSSIEPDTGLTETVTGPAFAFGVLLLVSALVLILKNTRTVWISDSHKKQKQKQAF